MCAGCTGVNGRISLKLANWLPGAEQGGSFWSSQHQLDRCWEAHTKTAKIILLFVHHACCPKADLMPVDLFGGKGKKNDLNKDRGECFQRVMWHLLLPTAKPGKRKPIWLGSFPRL